MYQEFISVVVVSDTDRIKVLEIIQWDVENVKCMLDQRWEGVTAIQDTQKMHSMRVVKVNVVEYARHGLCVEWRKHVFKDETNESDESDLSDVNELSDESDECIPVPVAVNDWVVVVYDEVLYPGEVIGFNNEFVEVSTMTTSNRKTWHWPERPDILLYAKNQIKAKINQPIPTGSRGLYKFITDAL